jgi:phage antirepressor YoqD-like protein
LSALQRFDFHGSQLDVLVEGEDVWISVRRVCEALGLAYPKQFSKLKSASWATVSQRVTVAEDGKSRDTFVVHLRSLASWLHGIETWRISSPTVREKIERFQREAADVLADHFLRRRRAPAASEDPVASLLRKSPAELLQLAADLAREGELAKQRASVAEAKVAEMAPKAALLAEFSEHEGEFKLREAAKALGFGPNRFVTMLREEGFTYGATSTPMQRHVDAKRFRLVPERYRHHRTGETVEKLATRITPKGLVDLALYFKRPVPEAVRHLSAKSLPLFDRGNR